MHHGLAHRLQNRPRRFHVFRRTADHDRQAGLHRATLTTADGRVDDQEAANRALLGDAFGHIREAAVRVLAGGLAGNQILERKAAGMRAREFEPGFRIDLHHKDMGIVTAAAREAGVVIPLGAHVAQLIGSLRAQGHGGLDHSALLLLVEQLSGRTPTTSARN